MEKYEKETGHKAIWGNPKKVTEGFTKWQKGEKSYYENKDRISLYVTEGMKAQWETFAKAGKYKTISRLIRAALQFFIEYSSKINIEGKGDIDFLSALSHDLKEPLTSIKGHLQLLMESHRNNLDDKVISIINKVLDQCQTLESKIILNLDRFEIEEDGSYEGQYDILFIEDDIETSTILIDYFKSLDISCKGVETGLGALKELKRAIPKLILLDIILPDISGYDVMQKIKADEKLKDIPVYFLTAIPRQKVEIKAKELEATGFILKPFNLKDFEIIIETIKKLK